VVASSLRRRLLLSTRVYYLKFAAHTYPSLGNRTRPWQAILATSGNLGERIETILTISKICKVRNYNIILQEMTATHFLLGHHIQKVPRPYIEHNFLVTEQLLLIVATTVLRHSYRRNHLTTVTTHRLP
jgi:hypothetical protein